MSGSDEDIGRIRWVNTSSDRQMGYDPGRWNKLEFSVVVNLPATNLCRFRYLDVGYVPGEEMCPRMQPGNLDGTGDLRNFRDSGPSPDTRTVGK